MDSTGQIASAQENLQLMNQSKFIQKSLLAAAAIMRFQEQVQIQKELPNCNLHI